MNTGGEVSSPTGPDEVELSTFPFTEPTAIAGPITATLSVSTLAPDTELFVQLLDRGPDGTLLYLNRGMLRASHRQIDEAESQTVKDGHIYRPWRPHEDRETSPPGEETEYLIDVFPVGHVFLPGHELVVKVHAPPLDDNDYNYMQKTLPGQHTLHLGPNEDAADAADHPDVARGRVPGAHGPVPVRVDALPHPLRGSREPERGAGPGRPPLVFPGTVCLLWQDGLPDAVRGDRHRLEHHARAGRRA